MARMGRSPSPVIVVRPRPAKPTANRRVARRRTRAPRWLWVIHLTAGVATLFAVLAYARLLPDDGPLKFLSFAESWFVMEPQVEPTVLQAPAAPSPLATPSTAVPHAFEPTAAPATVMLEGDASEPSEPESTLAEEAPAPSAKQAKARGTRAAEGKTKAEKKSKASARASSSSGSMKEEASSTKHARSARAPKRSTSATQSTKSRTTSRPTPKRDPELEAAAALLERALSEKTID